MTKTEKKHISVKKLLTSSGLVWVYIVMFVSMSFLSPYFLSVSNILNILQQVAITAIIGIGMTLVIVSAGIDLSVGSVACLSAMGMALLNKFVDTLNIQSEALYMLLGVAAPMVLALLIGVVVGTINGVVISKFRIPPFIMTMGMMQICRGMVHLIARRQTVSIFPKPMLYLGSGKLFGTIPVSIVVSFLLVILVSIIAKRTKFGRYVYALGGNRVALHNSGVNTNKIEVAVYAISGLMASIGGIVLIGKLNVATPLLGDNYEMDAIAAAVVGGTSMSGGEGKILGTFFGAIVIGTLRNALNMLDIPTNVQLVVVGIVIIVSIVIDTVRKSKKD